MIKPISFALAAAFFVFVSCNEKVKTAAQPNLDSISVSYVKLVLNIGQYDPSYVDAYYGPDEWKPAELTEEQTKQFPTEQLSTQTTNLIQLINNLPKDSLTSLEQLRYIYLKKQLMAMQAKIKMLSGVKMNFDEESELLYDAIAPTNDEKEFEEVLKQLDGELPGKGNLSERLENFKKEFIIPKEKLDTVFKTAIAEARKRTLKYIELPEKESFELEFVTDKSWSGYNWYKGKSHSLIQINTDLPIYIDRAIDLACHEGYPGHHVYNAMLEKELVNKLKWMEYTVYPLNSPQSLIAEGTGNYGIDVAFPGEERIAYEKNVLFPLAGIDSSKAQKYYRILNLTKGLSYAGNEAARNYLDGKITKEQTAEWLVKYTLISKEKALKKISFIEEYKSYVINYNLGQDIVKEYIERNGGTEDQPEKRWELFEALISTPQTPSGISPNQNNHL